jgi:hypothetical protein
MPRALDEIDVTNYTKRYKVLFVAQGIFHRQALVGDQHMK